MSITEISGQIKARIFMLGGKSTQSSFGYEDETIIQRGTQFRITKIEKSNGNFFVDVEVVGQP
jgi:hypothetical protein